MESLVSGQTETTVSSTSNHMESIHSNLMESFNSNPTDSIIVNHTDSVTSNQTEISTTNQCLTSKVCMVSKGREFLVSTSTEESVASRKESVVTNLGEDTLLSQSPILALQVKDTSKIDIAPKPARGGFKLCPREKYFFIHYFLLKIESVGNISNPTNIFFFLMSKKGLERLIKSCQSIEDGM